MYIKIGTTNIKYSTSQDDYMIFSEVIDSQLSYERPVLVRTSDELDIWFGRSFTDRNYFEELLESGVTLFLYKPVKADQNKKGDNYIDLSSYEINNTLYYNFSELPEQGKEKTWYKIVSDNGMYEDENTKLKFEYLVWIDSEYVYVKNLPQNLDKNNTESLNNREVLSINYNGYLGPRYTYPEYKGNSEVFNIDESILLQNLPDLDKINSGYETLCYDINIEEGIDFGINLKESPYIIISGLEETVLIAFSSEESTQTLPTVSTRYYDRREIINIKNRSRGEIIEDLLKIMNNLKYVTSTISDTKYQVYTSFVTKVNYFYNLQGFSMTPNFDKTHDILSQLSSNSQRINFVSKTIGTDENLIKVNIEKLQSIDNYRITISRFDYSEVYEGSLFNLSNRIVNKINNDSKLVSCDVIETYTNKDGITKLYSLDDEERDSSLPTGEFELRRGKTEEFTPDMYKKAANSIFNDGDTVFFDFFLIPNIKNYNSKLDPDLDYYPEYVNFLVYSSLINCQILIQNSDNSWNYEIVDEIPNNPEEGIVYEIKQDDGGSIFMAIINGVFQTTTDREIINVYGNDYAFNYTEDIENRLVYFYRPMKVFGYDRPAYYLYLNGLLMDTYSLSIKDVLYDCPTKNPYEDEIIETRLQKYKCNYLVNNNQIYYYKKYQNGESFTTSNWMRFVMGKIQRELEKHKWEYISERMSGDIRTIIEEILSRISNSFSIVRRINLTEFILDTQNNKLDLTIETYMSDLVNNNISLDITLNYNN